MRYINNNSGVLCNNMPLRKWWKKIKKKKLFRVWTDPEGYRCISLDYPGADVFEYSIRGALEMLNRS